MARPLLLLLLATAVAACVGDSKAENIDRCVPGLVVFCACDDGHIGTQECDDDGWFAECVCGPAGDTDGQADAADAGDTGSDAGDVDGSGDTGDAGEVGDAVVDTGSPPLGALGETCADDEDCASGFCGDFSVGSYCTRDCLGTCDDTPSDWVCFNRVCTPPAHCDLGASDEGVGPGCADARCGGCPPDSVCLGFEFGRYECVCNEGFVQSEDFATCVDIDECAAEESPCPEVTTCQNTPGSFECACNVGFWGPSCEECPGGAVSPCSGNGTCDDGSDGTGICDCFPRYGGVVCDEQCFEVSPATCAEADLTDVVLSGRNLSGGDFTDANLSGISALGANFSGATLDRTLFVGTALANARFDNATGDGTQFDTAQLPSANFSNAVLTHADFSDATLGGALFAGGDFTNMTAPRAVLARVDATEADWSGGRFADADLSEAVLRSTVARGADFTRALMRSATLEEADFSAGAAPTGFRNADLSNVIAPAANFRGADLLGADFPDANLAGAIFADAQCDRTDFEGANLSGANLTGANLSNATLENAILTGAATTGITWDNTTCVDGTLSDDNGDTCEGHLN